jgi:hypothetical protein
MNKATQKYFKTKKGKKALKKARKKYDEADPERRRKQKRDYMRRKREENPDIWKYKTLRPEAAKHKKDTDHENN